MKTLLQGRGISPGIARGKIAFVADAASARRITAGDIACSRSFLPPLSNLARNAAGVVLAGSEADHGVSYIKETWKPAVLVPDISEFREGQEITIDGKTGTVYEGRVNIPEYPHHEPLRQKPKTKIYLHQSIPELASRAADLGTDGVGLLRTNLLVEDTGKHPVFHYLRNGKKEELVALIADGIERIARAFAPNPVWVRTMDFATDELALMEGGAEETVESNPLLGWRGLARSLQEPELFEADILALKRIVANGVGNVGVIFPLVRDITEYHEAKQRMRALGVIPHRDIRVGSMFETPSSALQIDSFIEEGLDLAFVGINDITMYTLAADRTNANMRASYDPANPAVLSLVTNLLKKCREAKVETTMSFLTPLTPHLGSLVASGLSSVTLQADRINEGADLLTKAERDTL